MPRGILMQDMHAVFSSPDDFRDMLTSFLKALTPRAKQERAVFLHCDPEIEESAGAVFASVSAGLGFRVARKEIQPRHTSVVDLTRDEATLLGAMHQKTRYNIRLAERHGVRVRVSEDPADIHLFYSLLKKTTAREHFYGHEERYYETQMRIFGTNGRIKIVIAEKSAQGGPAMGGEGIVRPIAALVIALYGTKAVYLHGASDYAYRNAMAPYLAQWEAIKMAKAAGMLTYDLWGIAPEGTRHERAWGGITRFKRGFGGREIAYVTPRDFVFKPFVYRAYNMTRALLGRE